MSRLIIVFDLPLRDPRMPPMDLKANKKLIEDSCVCIISVRSSSVGPKTARPRPCNSVRCKYLFIHLERKENS